LQIIWGGGSSGGTATGSGEINSLSGLGTAQGTSSFDSSGSSNAFLFGPGGDVSAGGFSDWGTSGSQVGEGEAGGLVPTTSIFDGTTTATGTGGFTGVFTPNGFFGGGGSSGTLDITSSASGTAGPFSGAGGSSTGTGLTSGSGAGFGNLNGNIAGFSGFGNTVGNATGSGDTTFGTDFAGFGAVTGADFSEFGFAFVPP
jgi:hypothetical protein